MKNKAVYNFEESNHGKFVSGQIVPEFEYLKIKVWIIECLFAPERPQNIYVVFTCGRDYSVIN